MNFNNLNWQPPTSYSEPNPEAIKALEQESSTMAREEARQIIAAWEAFRMAIKELEQESRTMTQEEARQIIAAWLAKSKGEEGKCGYIEGWFYEKDVEAFHMAIKALEQEPKCGEWTEVEISEHGELSIVSMRCNQCGRYAYLVLPKGTKCVYDYCPWCKADMRGDKE